jgi:hypothetical protein
MGGGTRTVNVALAVLWVLPKPTDAVARDSVTRNTDVQHTRQRPQPHSAGHHTPPCHSHTGLHSGGGHVYVGGCGGARAHTRVGVSHKLSSPSPQSNITRPAEACLSCSPLPHLLRGRSHRWAGQADVAARAHSHPAAAAAAAGWPGSCCCCWCCWRRRHRCCHAPAAAWPVQTRQGQQRAARRPDDWRCCLRWWVGPKCPRLAACCCWGLLVLLPLRHLGQQHCKHRQQRSVREGAPRLLRLRPIHASCCFASLRRTRTPSPRT